MRSSSLGRSLVLDCDEACLRYRYMRAGPLPTRFLFYINAHHTSFCRRVSSRARNPRPTLNFVPSLRRRSCSP